jgi:hypothetical protein
MAPGAVGLVGVIEDARKDPGSGSGKEKYSRLTSLIFYVCLLFFTCPLMGGHPPKNGTVFFSHTDRLKRANQFVKIK